MKLLLKKAKMIATLILAISILGCEEDDFLIPDVVAGFTLTVNEDTGTVTFINISEKATSFEWDFGDGTTSTEINPIKTYATGNYTVSLTASNTAGASSTVEDDLVIVVPEPVTLPITFDESAVNYDVSVFGGAAFAILANPDVSGSNDEDSQVGQITNSGAEFEGFFFDLGTPIDLTEDKTISMNFWAEAPVDVLMKLEEGTGASVELAASHGGTGWEMLSFDFSSSDSFSRLTLFVDGPGTTAGTFFIDDIEQAGTPPVMSGCTDTPIAATALPVDFEGCETFLSSENFGDGITSDLVENPFKTGINTSDFVLQVDKPSGSSFFAGIQNTFASNFDLTTTDVFKLKVYSTKANVVFRFELALNPQTVPVTGNPAPVFVTVPNANEWTEVEFTFTGLPGGPTAYNQLVIKPDNDMADSPITVDGTYYLDDLTLTDGTGGPGSGFDDGLLTNGDFENGADSWTIGVGTDPAPVATDSGNSFYSVNVTAAGNPFDVNLTQKLEIVQDATYTLTFDAWSDVARSIVAGIGLSGGSFANTTETVNITTVRQTYTLTLTAAGFGAPDARVLFDSGAEIGLVNIDNVSLVLGTGDTEAPVITLNGDATVNLNLGDPAYVDAGATATDNVDGDISGNITVGGDTVDTNVADTYTITYNVSDAAGNAATEVTRTVIVADNTFDDGLLTNGDFENGSDSWTVGVGVDPAPVVTDSGNSFYSVDVTVAGNPFDVNLTQKLEIVQDATYTLTFDAWSDRARGIVAGIGLSGGSFANTAQTVNITTVRQTYTLTLTATGFGAPDARVLFDSGAEVGLVNIDNVSLVLDSSGGGDTEAPVITLNGDATVDLNLGDPAYVDAGATATDNVDGDISGSIVVGGDTVDTNVAGTYTITYNVSDAAGNAATEVTRTVNVVDSTFDDGLLTNGDFENGSDSWTVGVGVDPAPVVTDSGNSFYSVDVTVAGNPFDVNLTQKLEIVQDATYTLTFDAWSDRARGIVAGIGLSGGSFANTAQTVNITTVRQTYTLTLTATGFGAPDARVLFDSGAEVGLVNIDNVSLVLDSSGGGGGPAGELATNGDFETGDATGWDLFQNGGTAALDNTLNNGGSWSGRIATGGPSNPAFKQERIGAGTVNAGDVVQIQFDHIGSVVQPGAVFNVLLFGEGAAGASFTHVFSPAPTLTGSWTTFIGTFTVPAVDVSEGISFLIEGVCGGDAGCSVTANIDNVSVTLNP
ncbi:immunoglobulin-like domain-containing protein [Flavobacteriaceae bacterium 3-367]